MRKGYGCKCYPQKGNLKDWGVYVWEYNLPDRMGKYGQSTMNCWEFLFLPLPAFLFKNGAICIVDRSVSPSNGDSVIIYNESQGFQRITFSERVDNEQVWGVVTWICHEACGSKANSSVRL